VLRNDAWIALFTNADDGNSGTEKWRIKGLLQWPNNLTSDSVPAPQAAQLYICSFGHVKRKLIKVLPRTQSAPGMC
jgi:hypothetical protein